MSYPTSASLLSILWSMSWQAAALGGLVWLVARVLRSAPAWVRHALWCVVLIKFFMPPVLPIPVAWSWGGSLPESHVQGVPVEDSPGWISDLSIQSYLASPVLRGEDLAPKVAPAVEKSTWRIADVVAGLWICGAVVVAGRLLACRVQQGRLVRDSMPAGEEIVERTRRAAGRMGLRACPAVRVSPAAPTPMVVGVWSPVILLPMSIAESGGGTELDAMLLHEAAHIRRRDLGMLWLHQLAGVCFYFHPVLSLAGRALRREQELAADELVLARSSLSRREYAAGYLAALKLANGLPIAAASAAMAEPFEIEKRRLTMILNPTHHSGRGTWMLVLAAALGLPSFSGFASGPSAAGHRPSTDEIREAFLRQNEASIEVRYTGQYIADASPATNATGGSGPAGGARGGGRGPADGAGGGGGVRPAIAGAGAGQATGPKASARGNGNLGERLYIRTPDMLYTKVGGTEAWSSRKDVTRITETCGKSGRGDNVGGQINMTSSARAWMQQDRVDTVTYPMYPRRDDDATAFLYGWIKYGQVSEKMEPVGGHDCWKVEVTDTGDCIVKCYRFWLDPVIGLNPRRIQMDGKTPHDEGFTLLVNLEDYAEVTKGIWFPRKQTLQSTINQNGKHISKNIWKVQEVRADREYDREEYKPEFPPGAQVSIDSGNRRNQWHIVNQQGQLEPTGNPVARPAVR